MAITPEQQQAMNNMAGIQFALPQTVQKVTKKSWSSQGTEYDKDKMQALRDALGLPRPKMTWQEALANTLSQAQNPQAFTGGFGEQFIDPFGTGFASLARGFGNTYGVRAANAREVAEKEREDAIKMAELENEAAKKVVSSQVMDDYIKYNDPNGKALQEKNKVQEGLNALYALKERNRQNVADFDNAFRIKNPDGSVNIDKTMEAYKGHNKHGFLTGGRNWTAPNSWWGWGESESEADARQRFQAYKETQLRNIYDTLRGAGAITEKELEVMGKTADKASNPYELDLAIDEFINNIEAKQGNIMMNNQRAAPVVIDGYTILPE